MILSENLQKLAQAIARYEGFYVSESEAKARGIAFPTIPQRLNNPGDLMFMGQPGAVVQLVKGPDGKVRSYAKFETLDQGWRALYEQIQLDAARGEALGDFISKYAPILDGNNTSSYAAFVARQLGVTLADKLADVVA